MTEDVLWRDDEERFVEYRANYLHRQADLKKRKGRVLALSELGYSTSGIAREVDHTASTVEMYLEEIAARFGESAIHTKHPDDLGVNVELESVTREAVMAYPEATREWWLEIAEEYRDVAPAWVRETLDSSTGLQGGAA